MHATIQKKMDVILSYIKPEEKVFVVGCGNCAEKCKSGGTFGGIKNRKFQYYQVAGCAFGMYGSRF